MNINQLIAQLCDLAVEFGEEDVWVRDAGGNLGSVTTIERYDAPDGTPYVEIGCEGSP